MTEDRRKPFTATILSDRSKSFSSEAAADCCVSDDESLEESELESEDESSDEETAKGGKNDGLDAMFLIVIFRETADLLLATEL